MNELRQALLGDSAHTPPTRITEGLSSELCHAQTAMSGSDHPSFSAPHTIYQELWHIAFWLRITLDWIEGVETPYPTSPHDAFATAAQTEAEPWEQLRQRFARDIQAAADLTSGDVLDRSIQCPSRPGEPTRTMTVHEQLISLAAHNSYHFGRIVLLRQLHGAWPPQGGGFTW
jgi:uncharacterized damage-inducible protein DinB